MSPKIPAPRLISTPVQLGLAASSMSIIVGLTYVADATCYIPILSPSPLYNFHVAIKSRRADPQSPQESPSTSHLPSSLFSRLVSRHPLHPPISPCDASDTHHSPSFRLQLLHQARRLISHQTRKPVGKARCVLSRSG